MKTTMKTTTIRTLRRIAERLGFSVYRQGGNWILSDRETETLHYSIETERQALLVGLRRAYDRDMLNGAEMAHVEAS